MNTSERILYSMYELISQVGYEKASINKICSNIGVTKSSFYHFYASKEDALLEVIKGYCIVDYTKELKKIKKTRSKDEYKNQFHNIIYKRLNAFTNDEKWRKVCAEIYLQTTRIPQIEQIVNQDSKDMLAFIKRVLEHGVKIAAFPKNFDVQENTQNLFIAYLGIDTAILCDFPIDLNLIKKTIKRLF